MKGGFRGTKGKIINAFALVGVSGVSLNISIALHGIMGFAFPGVFVFFVFTWHIAFSIGRRRGHEHLHLFTYIIPPSVSINFHLTHLPSSVPTLLCPCNHQPITLTQPPLPLHSNPTQILTTHRDLTPHPPTHTLGASPALQTTIGTTTQVR